MSQQPNDDSTPAQSGDGFYCESVFGVHTQKPYVQITFRRGDEVMQTQIPPANARELAMNLFQCAEAADMDAMVIRFFQARLHLSLDKAAQIILDLRALRDETYKP